MTRRGLIFVAILAIGFGLVLPAQAAAPKVNDQAGFFSKSAIDQATAKLQEIRAAIRLRWSWRPCPRFRTSQQVHNFDAAKTEAEKKRSFALGRIRAEDEGVKGIYILICKSPGHLRIEPDEYGGRKAFTSAVRDELVDSDSFRF